MSEGCYMIIEFSKDEMSLDERARVAFDIIFFASKYKIGANLGINTSSYSWEYLKSIGLNEMFVEITEDPEDFNIQNLFLGELFFDYKLRMNNIKNFLQKIYNLKIVRKITLDIDPYRTETETIELETPVINLYPGEFKELMYKLHEENGHNTPHIRLIMDKRINDNLFIIDHGNNAIN